MRTWKILSAIFFTLGALDILGSSFVSLVSAEDAILGFIFGALYIILGAIASRKDSAMRTWKILSVIFYTSAAFDIPVGIFVTLVSDKIAIGIFIFGALYIILGAIASRKDSAIAKGLTLLAEGGRFSPRYFIGNEGIYMENKLFLKWSEIFDIFVIREYEKSFFTYYRGYGEGSSYKMGTIRVITKDGRGIDITNVINPKEIVEYIKNIYLK